VGIRPFNVLSLCSGIGGLDRGLRMAVPSACTVCYVEIEAFACEILASRMEDGSLDQAPVWSNLRTFDGSAWSGVVDCVIGGYPCQPFSTAGKRRGEHDARHLWPDVRRIIGQTQPAVCFFENVSGHVSMGFETVANDLQGMGYRIAAGLFTAAEVGAPHKRERLFILADHDSRRCLRSRLHPQQWQPSETVSYVGGPSDVGYPDCFDRQRRYAAKQQRQARSSPGYCDVGYPYEPELEGRAEPLAERADERPAWPPGPTDAVAWQQTIDRYPELAPAVEPPVRGMVNGVTSRVDRLHALGNAVVPRQAAYAFAFLWEQLTGAYANLDQGTSL
jgi:DNA (cytosine-5)-methyltransferase 1